MRPILFLGIGLLTACSGAPSSQEQVASAEHARATDPDLCAEHGVLEAVCTQCNPSLAPVFRAKGDWCDEHGFPESFCPICNPEAGGRPAADVSVDGSPPDNTRVRFKTREAAALAGIEVAQAQASHWSGGTVAVARLDWDATRVASVTARSSGVVVAVAADVGRQVDAGDELATLRSAHVGGDRSRLGAADRAVRVARAEVERKRDLLGSGVTSEREVLAAEQALATAEAELGALQAELGLVGAGRGDAFTVTSPLAGVVTERHAAIGQSVDPTTPLYQVVDPSRMWAELDVAESDLQHVAPGQAVRIVLDALPDRAFEGTVDYLAPSVDPHTRTARARVGLPNPDGALRANMYGQARIVTSDTASVVTVPSASVQAAGDVHLVFVRESADVYVARRVRVLARRGDRVRIEGPIQAGDPVATTGSFLLKTETLEDSIGAGCCDVE